MLADVRALTFNALRIYDNGGNVSLRVRFIALLSLAFIVVGCASDVVRQRVDLQERPGPTLTLADQVEVRFDSGFERTLRRGSRFKEVGRIQQGRVLQPIDTVFTVEGRHVHEAYLVVNDEKIIGFYLPVEAAYTPVGVPTAIQLR